MLGIACCCWWSASPPAAAGLYRLLLLLHAARDGFSKGVHNGDESASYLSVQLSMYPMWRRERMQKYSSRRLSRRSARTDHDALNRRPPRLLLALALSISLRLRSAARVELLLRPVARESFFSPSAVACTQISPFSHVHCARKSFPKSSCSRPRFFRFISAARETKAHCSAHPSSSQLLSFGARD